MSHLMNIFISYSRKDELFARLLATDLSRKGRTIWIDLEEIPAGVDWRRKIDDGLSKSNIMLLILSPDSIASSEVTKEWKYFLQSGKTIIPILWRNGIIKPTELQHIHHIDFANESYSSSKMKLEADLVKLGFVGNDNSEDVPTSLLRKRDELLEFGKITKYAKEITILAISSARITGEVHYGHLKERLMNGCNINVVLLNPENAPAIETFEKFAKWDRTRDNIDSMIDFYRRLNRGGKYAGKCLIRFVDFYLSYSLVGADIDTQHGQIRISYFGYKATGDRCPQVLLKPSDEWYDFYKLQVKSLWDSGITYEL